MQFAIALPWWNLLLLVAAIVAVGVASYAGAIVPLPPGRRAALSTIRTVTLLLIIAALLRPVRVMPPDTSTDAVVPVLVDASRSMSLADPSTPLGARARSRIDTASDLLDREIRPALAGRFQTEVLTFGSGLAPVSGGALTASQPHSDLSGALRAVRERYRERRVAAVVVLSDGGDTGREEAAASVDDATVPVYAIGVGAPRIESDFEILDVSAGETALADASVDLTVTAVNRGGRGAFDLRVLANGRPVDLRHVTPAADGSPVRAVFTVSPARETATLYTVEIPSAAGELVLENNRRSVLVEPPGRRRRVLIVEGAPGFEHSFLKRALVADAGLEIDSVVRKGRDAGGDPTYFVQASEDRAPNLTSGFPQDRRALFQYDAVILANVDTDSLSRAQLETVNQFVGERGGGLLVLGAKSFEQQALVRTAVEEVLPVGLTDRGGGVVRASQSGATPYTVTLTDEGAAHPVMRIGPTADDTAKRWREIPALAGASALGAPRPGAQVLALVRAPDGPRPLVAVQRYGQGRAMVFTGEASWRWRMQRPSEDRSYELFWRQVARWLSSGAPDPVSVLPMAPETASAGAVALDVRDEAFAPVTDAQVTVSVTLPGGDVQEVRAALSDPRTGRYSADMRFEQPGIYRVRAQARKGTTDLGSSDRWILAGGVDREMAEPRLNEDVLRRIAAASGGAYLPAGDASRLASLLSDTALQPASPQLQELWHTPWVFAAVILLLAAEWVLRRQWGLR
jgi:uncharacterized membrane protein